MNADHIGHHSLPESEGLSSIFFLPIFSPSGFALLCLTLITLMYLWATLQQRRNGHFWSPWRSISFVVGILFVAVALAPPVAQLAHHDLRVHMIQHILIGMLAPLGLALAAPLTLTLKSVPPKASRWLVKIVQSPVVTWLGNPFTALLLNIGGMYLLYLTPLYAMSLTNSGLHYVIHLHFLIAGYLFTWAIAGVDPALHRPSLTTRVQVLFIAIAAHVILAKLMYIYLFPWNTPHSAEEIRSAAKIMYYGGDFAELLLTIALFSGWYVGRKVLRNRPVNKFTQQTS